MKGKACTAGACTSAAAGQQRQQRQRQAKHALQATQRDRSKASNGCQLLHCYTRCGPRLQLDSAGELTGIDRISTTATLNQYLKGLGLGFSAEILGLGLEFRL